ncbi:MAG: 3-isopropylmalate dehydratase small subunit [SAR324 cluster bacterium]|nr:3-isopropylmalate dehydratase small subunit [SAR324 cluster bacterium]
MQPFHTLKALAAPLNRMNVDTDAIIPKQFLKKIERTGFGVHLFHEWRYLDQEGTQINPDFVLNTSRYQGAQILVAGDNFGCGSSREHAPWALLDYGFRCIIAPSFADIFYNNCFKNGILPVVLAPREVQSLMDEIETTPGYQLTVNLETQQVTTPSGKNLSFKVDAFSKDCLIKGLDDIGWTLQFQEKIMAFEQQYRQSAPWMFVG